jgi:hypothetical protein
MDWAIRQNQDIGILGNWEREKAEFLAQQGVDYSRNLKPADFGIVPSRHASIRGDGSGF